MASKSIVCLAALWCAVGAIAAEEIAPQDVAFISDIDGTEQRYVLTRPDVDLNQPLDLLIVLHGHGRDRWQFTKEDFPAARAARDFAKKHEMLYVTPAYRAKTSWMGPKAEADIRQIISDFRKNYEIRHVYISGGSMGGSSALTYAALHPEDVDGVMSMNGTANHLEYANYQDAIIESFGGTKAEIPEVYKQRSAEYWPERLTMPIAVTTGGKDKAVPPESVSRLVNILKMLNRPVLQIHRENGGHSTTYEDAMQAYEFVIQKAEENDLL